LPLASRLPRLTGRRPEVGRRSAGLALVVIVGLTCGFLVAEAFLRASPWPFKGRPYMVTDPVRHHRLIENFDGMIKGTRFTTNSLGLRDREYPIPKPPGVFRILMLGDSFTEGGGLPPET